MAKGTIIKGIGGFYYVKTETGVYECRARGKFRKEKITPLVGDFGEISILDEKNKKGSLDKIYERKNFLIRPKVANIDQGVIVFAAKSPDMNLDLLDRFIVLVEEQGLDIVICINKIDLDVDENYKKVIEIYGKSNFKVIPLSAEKGENIEALKEALKGKISVFAGPSGVGKSSLINMIDPSLKLNTGEISAKIERGKHTTRFAELLSLDENTFIVDSPGFTSLFLTHIDPKELENYFKEFEPHIGQCRFIGCSHINEPDCKIKNEIGLSIPEERYSRYKFLYNELKEERKK